MEPLLQYFKSNPNVLVGCLLLVMVLFNVRHALKQQDAAFDMPEDTDVNRICRQIRMLETRVWSMGWKLFAAVALLLLFI